MPGRLESYYQSSLEAELASRGWRYYHTHTSTRSVAGFPDVVALRGSRILPVWAITERRN